MVKTEFDPTEVQGNILRGYRRSRVRYLMLTIKDAAQTRQWLGRTLDASDSSAPTITSEAPWSTRPDYCFNLGISFQGLRALQLNEAALSSFPDEYRSGMAARATKIGDVGNSAPEHWHEAFRDSKALHLICNIHADDQAHLDSIQKLVESGTDSAFKVLAARDGWNFDGSTVHFGYRDNISQPRFQGVHDPARYPDAQPQSPLGSVLLGYPTAYEGLRWRVPEPTPLGHNGTFNAFRILQQDVEGFERYLDQAADELQKHPQANRLAPPGIEKRWTEQQHAYKSSAENHWFERYLDTGFSYPDVLRELVAAALCGRWRNGVPMALSPDTPFPDTPVSLTDFDYPQGSGCPFGSHTRRCNPRGGHIVQRVANNTRRLVRRGMPYGPVYDPANPDQQERGLLGNFLSGNLGAQFEAVMCDWLNLGLQDPRVTGSNDPLLGVNDEKMSWFDLPVPDSTPIRLRGLPRFVETRGGEYLFLPGLPAIRHIASL